MASQEQRGTFRLLAYWNGIKEASKLPDIAQISLSDMSDLWDLCFILDVTDREKPEFQHFGSDLITVFGKDHTGEKLEEVEHPVLQDLQSFMEEVWLMEAAVSHCGDIDAAEGRFLYRSLLAPLSEDYNDEIQYLIGTTNFRLDN